jgi:hypothetical protein
MIVKHLSGYTLRQIEVRPVVYVTMPDKSVRKVLNTVLTDKTARAIVYGISASIGDDGKTEKVGIGR